MFKINRDVKPKPEIAQKIIFRHEDLLKIFDNLEQENENFKILVNILYYTGLRASNILNIDVSSIDLQRHELVYYSPKRKANRLIAFHEALVPVFAKVLKERQAGKLVNYKTVESLQRAISRYQQKIGLGTKSYTSRTFRKTFITIARKAGMDESVVKELVGHSHQSTTDKFYNR